MGNYIVTISGHPDLESTTTVREIGLSRALNKEETIFLQNDYLQKTPHIEAFFII